jgi:hypothetical protein
VTFIDPMGTLGAAAFGYTMGRTPLETQQPQQLGDVGRDPPRLVASQHVRRRLTPLIETSCKALSEAN